MEFIREVDAGYQVNPIQSTVYHGDAATLLKRFPDNFFRCVVTSPPYWGLRDYGTKGQIGNEEDPSEYVQRLIPVFE